MWQIFIARWLAGQVVAWDVTLLLWLLAHSIELAPSSNRLAPISVIVEDAFEAANLEFRVRSTLFSYAYTCKEIIGGGGGVGWGIYTLIE